MFLAGARTTKGTMGAGPVRPERRCDSDPGFTYANLAVNYSADQLNNASGNPFPHVNGTYSFWLDENIIYYVPSQKILGGYFMPYITLSYATGELVADISGTNLSSGGGGSGFADIYVEPINFGWHLGDRVDFNAGYAFTAPTGRYSPGASDNVGSGYWGHNITTGTTLYVTKDHGTTVNLATDWEIHGSREAAGFPVGRTSEHHAGTSFHDGVGNRTGAAVEQRSKHTGPNRTRRIRPVAGYRQQRQFLARQIFRAGEQGSSLLRARHRWSSQSHFYQVGSAVLL